jgi:hypothetical protein
MSTEVNNARRPDGVLLSFLNKNDQKALSLVSANFIGATPKIETLFDTRIWRAHTFNSFGYQAAIAKRPTDTWKQVYQIHRNNEYIWIDTICHEFGFLALKQTECTWQKTYRTLQKKNEESMRMRLLFTKVIPISSSPDPNACYYPASTSGRVTHIKRYNAKTT